MEGSLRLSEGVKVTEDGTGGEKQTFCLCEEFIQFKKVTTGMQ